MATRVTEGARLERHEAASPLNARARVHSPVLNLKKLRETARSLLLSMNEIADGQVKTDY